MNPKAKNAMSRRVGFIGANAAVQSTMPALCQESLVVNDEILVRAERAERRKVKVWSALFSGTESYSPGTKAMPSARMLQPFGRV
jgi:hypothetical protein